MFPLTTTLTHLQKAIPGRDDAYDYLRAFDDKTPGDKTITYEKLLDALGLDGALYCCSAEPQYSALWRQYAVWCARQVHDLVLHAHVLFVLDEAQGYADGKAAEDDLNYAKAIAESISSAAMAARWAASIPAWAGAYRAAGCAREAVAHFPAERDPSLISISAQSAAFRQLVTTGTLPT
jgi:hypothetical protein